MLGKKAKISTKSITFIIIFLVIAGFGSGITTFVILRERNSGEIVILKDVDFTKKYSFPGSGTDSDPYRIENFTITTEKKYGILIKRTKSQFVIQNCTITSMFLSVLIVNVADNTVTINNNNFKTHAQIEKSTGITITNNILYGLDFKDSSTITLSSNSFTPTKPWVRSFTLLALNCFNITITDNLVLTMNQGIYLGNSELCHIKNNTFLGEYTMVGINARDSKSIIIENNLFRNTTFARVGMSNAIYLGRSSNTQILNNTFCFNDNAITLYYSDECILLDNVIENCVSYSIVITHSHLSIIEKNVLENNKKGIIIHLWSNSSWIYTNCFINQTEYAIVIDESCFLSMIYQNNFINNNPNGALFLEMGYAQAFDTETNLWYNKETNIGNYWSDLLWYEGVIYDIDGGNNTDPYPLENPVSI